MSEPRTEQTQTCQLGRPKSPNRKPSFQTSHKSAVFLRRKGNPCSDPSSFEESSGVNRGIMSNSKPNEDYYAALQLNNIGIDFICKGHHKEAVMTLSDSLTSMKKVFKVHAGAGVTPMTMDASCDVQRKLQRAKQRWIKLCSAANPQEEDEGTFGARLAEDTLLYENCFIPALCTTPAAANPPPRLLRPTRIALPRDASNFGARNRDPDLEVVVILSNLSASFYLMSETIKDENLKTLQELHRQTANLFDLASNIVTNRFADCDGSIEEAKLISVALLVSGNAVHFYKATGQNQAESEFKDKHRYLQATLGQGLLLKNI
jgi:hypothetical protein